MILINIALWFGALTRLHLPCLARSWFTLSGNAVTDKPDISFLGDTPMDRALTLMARLRDKETGCPWDMEQTYATIAPYTIEEAYEVADAIERGNIEDLKSELGDLLMQVVFQSQIAAEAGDFTFGDVADRLVTKMVSRHPHVFGDQSIADADAQTVNWENQKAQERAQDPDAGVLDGVALGLPALMRAQKLQKRAARVGFDWPDITPALKKVGEEAAEITQALKDGESQERLEEEVGDLLFAVVNIARHLGVDAEVALRSGNAKFTRRFEFIESRVKSGGGDIAAQGLEKLDALWDEAKKTGL